LISESYFTESYLHLFYESLTEAIPLLFLPDFNLHQGQEEL